MPIDIDRAYQDWFNDRRPQLDQLRRELGLAGLYGNPIIFGGDPVVRDHPLPPVKFPPQQESKMISSTKPPFFLPYETLEEIRMRLEHSIIRYNGHPVYVNRVKQEGRSFVVLATNWAGVPLEVPYLPDSGWDLSPFPSQYYNRSGSTCLWTYRNPIRGVYRQGACYKNTNFKQAVDGAEQGARDTELLKLYTNPTPVRQLLEALKGAKLNYGWSQALSPNVAIRVSDKGNDIFAVDHKSLFVGEFDRKDNLMKENFTLTPWCMRRLDEVGIRVKEY